MYLVTTFVACYDCKNMSMNYSKLCFFVCVVPLSFLEIRTHLERTAGKGSLFLQFWDATIEENEVVCHKAKYFQSYFLVECFAGEGNLMLHKTIMVCHQRV